MKNLKERYKQIWIRRAKKHIYSEAMEEMKLWEHILERVWTIEHPNKEFNITSAGEYTKLYIREFQSKLDRKTGRYGKSRLLGISIRYEFINGILKDFLNEKGA
jgi:hypothetical protein